MLVFIGKSEECIVGLITANKVRLEIQGYRSSDFMSCFFVHAMFKLLLLSCEQTL